jgi:hypothetical protein
MVDVEDELALEGVLGEAGAGPEVGGGRRGDSR